MKHSKFMAALSLAVLLILPFSFNALASGESTENFSQTGSELSASAKNLSYEEIMIPAALKDRPEQILKRKGYVASYNKDMRVPNWVAWHLTASHTDGPASRKGVKFQEDYDVPSPRATHADYVRSGFDRGHICPAGDNQWSSTAMQQSFLMTNICPQHPNLNRGDWNEMENACRRWAVEYGDLVIVAGPIYYKGNHKKIGRNKIQVPEAFFKVVLTLGDNPRAVGFIYKNNRGNLPKDAYVNTIDDVERITGIDFFPQLPDELENKLEKQKRLL